MVRFKTFFFFTAVILCEVLIQTQIICAEDLSGRLIQPYWFDVIVGSLQVNNKAGTLDGTNGLTSGVAFHCNTNKGLLGARVLSIKNKINVRHGTYNDYFEDGNEATEIGILYGFYSNTDDFLVSGSIGVSNVNGIYAYNDRVLHYTETEWWLSRGLVEVQKEKIIFDRRSFNTIGMPLELQLSYTGLRYFGLGGYVFADINSKLNFFGAGVNLQFGRFY